MTRGKEKGRRRYLGRRVIILLLLISEDIEWGFSHCNLIREHLYWAYYSCIGHSELIFSFWPNPSFLYNVDGRVIKTIGLHYYALCSCSRFLVMYQNVHLLLDDIAVLAVKGDERCLGGP